MLKNNNYNDLSPLTFDPVNKWNDNSSYNDDFSYNYQNT